ncbi:lysoplasmalogenase [Belliella kenyensis]|uniref:Lysoplasmalogenase n=1 Tax=Belliella kenyensis TaxID=1472724 RepID=A0ABV8EJU4_9BACT|nr:lysoplasmalogenase [Belliella kenyensis]MCH7403679.1 lysoplasmalogenase [Belliella kenyensis]MDN3603446.1 lysoplasmalogenase [Belliella kenyensis]
MRDKNIVWLYLYLLACFLDLYFIIDNLESYRIYSKPLIMISLGVYFWQISKNIAGTLIRKMILGAIVFSWLGDVLLIFPAFFLYGLGAFLVAHLCYIISFKISQQKPFEIGNVNFIKLFLYNLPICILAAYVYFLIQFNLGSLKIPVITYMLVLVAMVTISRERFNKTNPSSFWQVFLGALFFLVSDGILAINMFYQSFPESGVLVMGTYTIAQLLIIMGIRAHYIR